MLLVNSGRPARMCPPFSVCKQHLAQSCLSNMSTALIQVPIKHLDGAGLQAGKQGPPHISVPTSVGRVMVLAAALGNLLLLAPVTVQTSERAQLRLPCLSLWIPFTCGPPADLTISEVSVAVHLLHKHAVKGLQSLTFCYTSLTREYAQSS